MTFPLRRRGYRDPRQIAVRRGHVQRILDLFRTRNLDELTVREVHNRTGISENHVREILADMCVFRMLTLSKSQRPRTYKLRPVYPMPEDLVERMQKNLANVAREAFPVIWEHSYPLSRKTCVTDVYEAGKGVRSNFRIVIGDQIAASESLPKRSHRKGRQLTKRGSIMVVT
jgi:hypothetical protein